MRKIILEEVYLSYCIMKRVKVRLSAGKNPTALVCACMQLRNLSHIVSGTLYYKHIRRPAVVVER